MSLLRRTRETHQGRAGYYGKYNPNGAFAGGQRSFTGMGEERCEVTLSDGLGSAYVAGFFSETLEMTSESDELIAEAGAMDFFVGRIGHALELHWLIQITGNTFPYSVMKGALGANNTLVLLAQIKGDAFIAVFDSAGAHLWSKNFGSAGPDSALAVARDADGALYVSVRHQSGTDLGVGSLIGVNQGVVVKFERE